MSQPTHILATIPIVSAQFAVEALDNTPIRGPVEKRIAADAQEALLNGQPVTMDEPSSAVLTDADAEVTQDTTEAPE